MDNNSIIDENNLNIEIKRLPSISASFDFLDFFNFSMQQTGLNFFQSMIISNNSNYDIKNLKVEILSEPKFFANFIVEIPFINANQSIDINTIELFYLHDYLTNLQYSINSNIKINFYFNEQIILTYTHLQKLLALDEWCFEIKPETLASFSIPHDDYVSEIISGATKLLKDIDLCFNGYESQDINIVKKQLNAIYSVIQNRKLNYSLRTLNALSKVQKIRLPGTISHVRLVNNLDLALLFSSCCEACGLNPIIILNEGNSYIGCWLENSSFSDVLNDDASSLSKNMAQGVNRIITLDPFSLTNSDISFEEAVSKGRYNVITKPLIYFIDIERARKNNIFSLPINFSKERRYIINPKILEKKSQLKEIKNLEQIDIDISTRDLEVGRFAKWKRDLLDVSLTNPLVNYNLNSAGIPILIPDLQSLEKSLSKEDTLTILSATPEMRAIIKNNKYINTQYDIAKYENELSIDLKSKRLRTNLIESQLNKKLIEIFRTSKNALEELGTNNLFLALGFLKWVDTNFEPNIDRFSPIVLIPVEINRKSINSDYTIKRKDENLRVNMSLIENLRLNFNLDASGLINIEESDDDLALSKILTMMRKIIINQKGWDIIEAASINLFLYSKFVLLNDINKREDRVKNNPIVKSFIENKIDNSILHSYEQQKFDKKIFLPLPADESQLKAIEDALSGRTFVLHGPPGTGKSQTITNIIANCLAYNKRVLFISEKQAALNVVKFRLDSIGLGDFALELHSNKMSKKNILTQFNGLKDLSVKAVDVNYKKANENLEISKSELDSFIRSMHKTHESGFSVYQGINKYLQFQDIDCIDIKLENININNNDYNKTIELLERIQVLSMTFSSPKFSPFYYMNVTNYSQEYKDNLVDSIKLLQDSYNEFKNYLDYITENFEVKSSNFNEIIYICNLIIDIYKFNQNTSLNRFFKSLFSKNIKYLKKQKNYNKIIDLIAKDNSYFKNMIKVFENFIVADKNFRNILNIDKNLSLPIYTISNYPQQINYISIKMLSSIDNLKDYMVFLDAFNCLNSKNICSDFLNSFFNGEILSQTLMDSYKKCFFKQFLECKINEDANLRIFSVYDFENKIRKFAGHCNFVQSIAADEIFKISASRVPSFKSISVKSSEPGILFKALNSKSTRMSVRTLFEKIPNLLTLAKPVMLLSPLTAAQYLPDNFNDFDLVIYDEASQLITHETVGCLSRAKAAVIVGDPKQLPPTTFFKNLSKADNMEDFETEDLESFLDDALALNFPQHYLTWHYRSRHESLITFSNKNFYESKLITFPSANDINSKVGFIKHDGKYDRGKTRTNIVEANLIVDYLFDRLKNNKSKDSFGIITFNSTQQKLILDILDKKLAKNIEFSEDFNKEFEAIFVKNIENVQGDERDIILFSMTYAKDFQDKIGINFGPINKDGGHRRLNVATTRARKEMVVFSGMSGTEIDLSKTMSKGVENLKEFLMYAENSNVYLKSKQLTYEETPYITNSVAEELRSLGYSVDVNIGKSSNKVDVAVIDDNNIGTYKLGIVIDTLNFSKMRNTKDREFSKISVLKNLGWKIFKLFTLEWYENKNNVLKRLENAINLDDFGFDFDTHNYSQKIKYNHGQHKIIVKANDDKCVEYVMSELSKNSNDLFYQKFNLVHQQILDIIKIESPIELNYLQKRIASIWSIQKLTEKFKEYFNSILNKTTHYKNNTLNNVFIFSSEDQAKKYNIYRKNDNIKREPRQICKEEYAVCILDIIYSSLTANEDDLIRETAKQFGFIKSPLVFSLIEQSIMLLIEKNILKYDDNGQIVLINK